MPFSCVPVAAPGCRSGCRSVPVVEIAALPLSLVKTFGRGNDPYEDWGRLLRFLSPLTIPGGPLVSISR